MKVKSIKIVKKILVIPVIAVIVGILIIAFVSSDIIKSSLLKEMQSNSFIIADTIAERLDDNIDAQETIKIMLNDQIKMVAYIVIKNKDRISNEYLLELAKDLEVTELHWLNKDGVITHSTVNGYLGWKVTPNHPLSIILSGKSELMEDIRPDSKFGKLMKYGAVKSSDGSFVQVGLSAEAVRKFTDGFSFQNLMEDITAGEKIVYAELMDKTGIILASNNPKKVGPI